MTTAAMLVFLAVLALPAIASAPPQSQSLAARLEQKLRGLKSLQTDFDQYYYSGTVSKPLHEKGRLYFRKPDLMRWEYTEPEPKVFLYKDEVFSQYYPEDSQLIRSALGKTQYESEVLTLLSGQKHLEEDYRVELDPAPPEAGSAGRLKLVPKAESEYAAITLDVDSRTGLVRKAVFEDAAGNRTEFIFNKIKANPRLKASVFVLEVPPDTEVIEDEAPLIPVKKEGRA